MTGWRMRRKLCVGILTAAVALPLAGGVGFAQDQSGEKPEAKATAAQVTTPQADQKSEVSKSVQQKVDRAIEKRTDDQRQKLVKDAVSAIASTRKALALLGEKKADEATQELKDAIGTLELVIARNPDLAFVPVAVETQAYDLLAKPETVRKALESAKEALDDGHVQVARRLLDAMASEIVISTHQLPLATYPDAIKAAIPMIDEGRINDAKQQLQLALNLLVVEDVIVPLPEVQPQVGSVGEGNQSSEASDSRDSSRSRTWSGVGLHSEA